jgi:glyoxylase-like metal-dependent hydrolase (beta-lactamase superfamily II)
LRAGRNPDDLRATDWEGRVLRPFLPWSAPPLDPDIVFEGEFDLTPYGVPVRTLHTPGHSPGHIALPLPGGAVIAGDMLRGGFLGGLVAASLPKPPFYVADPAQLRASLSKLLSLASTTIYVGHGGPLAAARVRQMLTS